MPDSRFLTVATTGSTNADMKAMAGLGAPEGSWLRAERQEAGRGRRGRAWASEPGNLHASTLVRLRETDPPAATLALVPAVAVQQVVSARLGDGVATIKWPNDLMIGDAKVAGILLEREGEAVVVGIGLNLAHAPDGLDRPATSLAAAGAPAIDPGEMLAALAESFAYWLGRWRGGGRTNPVRTRWMERAHPLGSALKVAVAETMVLEGSFDGIDDAGALRLRMASGEARVIHAGDVFLA